MINKGHPKLLWDHCIELEDLIRSCIDHSEYTLDGYVPETRMTGQNFNISNICEYEWYKWVMFHYQPIKYPYLPVALGRYLGTATEVRSTMTFNILKGNGGYVCRPTVRPLILTELVSP